MERCLGGLYVIYDILYRLCYRITHADLNDECFFIEKLFLFFYSEIEKSKTWIN